MKLVTGHEHVITFYDAYLTEEKCSLVMELCDGGELYDQIAGHGPYDEDQARIVMNRAVSGLQHMHSKGMSSTLKLQLR